MTGYEKLYGAKPATFGANVYDAGLLLAAGDTRGARRRARPGTPEFRAALRDALEATRELVATQGVYNMTPADHSGFDRRGRVLVTVKDGKWVLVPVSAALSGEPVTRPPVPGAPRARSRRKPPARNSSICPQFLVRSRAE